MAKPIVYLVGAGPGDSGLLTLRGKECLEQADFVLYDQLVAPRLLDFAPISAERVCVAELAAHHPERLPHIHVRLIDEARKGKCVVRLKGGDPLIFGRGGEEAEALRAAGIPFEIVPGVTAALAASAFLEIPLTHRSIASAVAFVTGHEDPSKPATRIDWKAVAAFPGTLVVYMGFMRLRLIIAELISHGKPRDTPAAAVSHASTGEQRTVTAPLNRLADEVNAAGLTTPALILVGPAVGLKPVQSWFESRPLLGKRVLITRPRGQALGMQLELERLGASAYLLPAIKIQAPADWSAVDGVQDRLRAGAFDWLVFTSANGVDMFLDRLINRGLDMRSLGSTKLAAIGPSTAAAMRTYHLQPDVTSFGEFNSEGLIADLKEHVVGKRVLIAQADRGRQLLRVQISEVARVETLSVYAMVDSVDRRSEAFDLLRQGRIDYITLTSPNIASSLLASIDSEIAEHIRGGKTILVANSPRVAAEVKAFGFAVTAIATDPTEKALINEVLKLSEMRSRNKVT
jgi:uroporphyrinogen III methyltransferase/synthase